MPDADTPGTAALDRWLAVLGERFSVAVSKGEAGWTLEGAGERWARLLASFQDAEEQASRQPEAVTVAAEPGTFEQWRDRLRLVEQSAARTLTDAPVGYSAVLPSTPEQGPGSTAIRFAFGLSLSLGHSLRRRFTAYSLVEPGTFFFFRGDDRLFSLGAAVGPLDLKHRALRTALPQLSQAAREAEAAYRQDDEVLSEIDRLRRGYAEELRCLERLYTSNRGQDAPLLGIPDEALQGEEAVEAEYLTRLEDLVDRYRPRVLFEPLTLGVIEGWREEQCLQDAIRPLPGGAPCWPPRTVRNASA